MKMITPSLEIQALIREYIRLDELTGKLYWIKRPGTYSHVYAGDEAGSINSNGYRQVRFQGRSFGSHQIVWFLYTGEWPVMDIDHKNLIKDDNRVVNLREADQSLNQGNVKPQKNNTCGYKGVNASHTTKNGSIRFRARIRFHGKLIHLGTHVTAEDAARAYNAKAKEIFGEFARLNDV